MIVIASDHGGFALKTQLLAHLGERGIPYEDFGCYSEDGVDYPAYAEHVAHAVASGECERGILICGTGIGVSMTANKIPGIRASLCADCYSAAMARAHNDANILCLGGRTLGTDLAVMILDAWLDTPFSGNERHARRISQISGMER